MPTVTGPSRGRLNLARRFKAVFPLLLVVTITVAYNVYVHHGRPIVLRKLPHDSFKLPDFKTSVLSGCIGVGLDRIKAAGFELSWDQREQEPPPAPPPRPLNVKDDGAWMLKAITEYNQREAAKEKKK